MHENFHDTFSRKAGNDLTGFGYPAQPSGISDDEMLSAMNIPPRDKTAYPDLSESAQVEAGAFLSKLNLIAATYDGNLQALTWEFYDKLSRYLTTETRAEDLISLVGTMDRMKDYLLKSKNPILFPPAETRGGPVLSGEGKGL